MIVLESDPGCRAEVESPGPSGRFAAFWPFEHRHISCILLCTSFDHNSCTLPNILRQRCSLRMRIRSFGHFFYYQ